MRHPRAFGAVIVAAGLLSLGLATDGGPLPRADAGEHHRAQLSRLVGPPVPDHGRPVGKLRWREEFVPRPRSTAPRPRVWGYDVGATGWGNGELQRYTRSRDNSFVAADGTLRIVTRHSDGEAPYTSARLLTRGKVHIGFGYLEARIKTPRAPAQGLWPAFWLRSDAPWPIGGEIDVMETVNGVHGYSTTVHGGPDHWQLYRWHQVPANDGRWHTYGVMFRPNRLVFFHDGGRVATLKKSQMPAGGHWPFSDRRHRWHVIVNQAMGGSYPGDPDGTARLPAQVAVDYIRYWDLPGKGR